MRTKLFLKYALWVSLASAPLIAQDAQSRKQAKLAEVPVGLSGEIVRQVNAMGLRLRTPGKEITEYDGELTDDKGKKRNLHVAHHLSGVVEIDEDDQGRSKKSPVKFDGTQSLGFSDRGDESLLETFVMDTVEGLIYSLRDGAHVSLIGRGFRPDSALFKNYTGPSYDIFEFAGRIRTHQDGQPHLKYYYFDSDTHLLLKTRYLDPSVSPGIQVETRFSDWHLVDGSAYPGRIERYENDYKVFSFNASKVTGRDKNVAASTPK